MMRMVIRKLRVEEIHSQISWLLKRIVSLRLKKMRHGKGWRRWHRLNVEESDKVKGHGSSQGQYVLLSEYLDGESIGYAPIAGQ